MGQNASQGECEVSFPAVLQSVLAKSSTATEVFMGKENVNPTQANGNLPVDRSPPHIYAKVQMMPVSDNSPVSFEDSPTGFKDSSSTTFAEDTADAAVKATASAAKTAGKARRRTAEVDGFLKERGAAAAAERQLFAIERARAQSKLTGEIKRGLDPSAFIEVSLQPALVDQVHWSMHSPRTPHCAKFRKKRACDSLIDTGSTTASSTIHSSPGSVLELEESCPDGFAVQRGLNFSL